MSGVTTSNKKLQQLDDMLLEKFLEKYKMNERDIKRAFSRFDKDNNGLLDMTELFEGISIMLNGVTESEIQDLVTCYDANGDGKLSFEEFMHMLVSRNATKNLKSNSSSSQRRDQSKTKQRIQDYEEPAPRQNSGRRSNHSYEDPAPRQTSGRRGGQDQYYNDLQDLDARPSSAASYCSQYSLQSDYSEAESTLDCLNKPNELSNRATVFLQQLKTMLLSRANSIRDRVPMKDRLSVHNHEFLETVAREEVFKSFQPFTGEQQFQRRNNSYQRSEPKGVSVTDFIRILRSFSRLGVSTVQPQVCQYIFGLCSQSPSIQLLGSSGAQYRGASSEEPFVNHSQLSDVVFSTTKAATNPNQLDRIAQIQQADNDLESAYGITEQRIVSEKAVRKGPYPLVQEGCDAAHVLKQAPDTSAGGNTTSSAVSAKRVVSKICRTPYTIPVDFDQDMVRNSSLLPDYHCVREHLFGMSTTMYSGHLIHAVPSAVLGNTKIVGRENDNVMIYATSAIGVVHNVKTNTQSFFEGHTDDVCCISMSLDGHTVATGQVGKNPFVLVWQMASLLGCNQDDCEASSRDCLIAMLGGPAGGLAAESATSSSSAIRPVVPSNPGYFQRGICALELSPSGDFLCAISCDDHHRLGIFALPTGVLVADVPSQNGIPPQIKGMLWSPSLQTTPFISRDHSANPCDMFCTVGVHHIKFWSFARNGISPLTTGANSNAAAAATAFKANMLKSTVVNPELLKCRGGRITKQYNVPSPEEYLCIAYILCDNGSCDVVTGGSNGFLYLWREGILVACSRPPSKAGTAPPKSIGKVNCIRVLNKDMLLCGGRGEELHIFDGRTLVKLKSISLLDGPSSGVVERPAPTARPASAGRQRPPLAAAKVPSPRTAWTAADTSLVSATNTPPTTSNHYITGLAVFLPLSADGSGSRAVNKGKKTVEVVLTCTSGVARLLKVQVSGAPSTAPSSALQTGRNSTIPTASSILYSPARSLFHYHTGSLWGLCVDGSSRSHSPVKGHRDSQNPWIVTAGDDRMVCIWDMTSKSLIGRITGTKSAAKCCHMDKRRRFIAVGFSDGSFGVYAIRGGSTSSQSDGLRSLARPSSSHSNRSDASVSSFRSSARPPSSSGPTRSGNGGGFPLTLTKVVHRKDATEEISDIKFDGKTASLAVGSHDNYVYIYRCVVEDEASQQPFALSAQYKLKGHSSYVTHIDYSRDGTVLRSTCGAYEILYWDMMTGRQYQGGGVSDIHWRTHTCPFGFGVMGIWPSHADGTDINAIDVCTDSNLVATADDFGQLKLFRHPCVVQQAPSHATKGYSSHVMNVRFFTVGYDTFLATTGGNDATLLVYQAKPSYH